MRTEKLRNLTLKHTRLTKKPYFETRNTYGHKSRIVNVIVEAAWINGGLLYMVTGIAARGRQRFFPILDTPFLSEAMDVSDYLNEQLQPNPDALLQETGIGM